MSDHQTIFRNASPAQPYTLLPNALLQDPDLTADAGWVLVFMLSQPRNWDFNVKHVGAHRKLGRDGVYRAIKQLIELRYCKRVEHRNSAGRVEGYEYLFTDTPGVFAEPLPGKPEPVSPLPENPEADLPEAGNRDAYKGKTPQTKDKPPVVPQGDDCAEAFKLWNETAQKLGLSKASKLTDDRKRKLKARLADYGLDGWRQALRNVEGSRFLRGLEGERNWRCSFDWLALPSNFSKVVDGAYLGKAASPKFTSFTGTAGSSIPVSEWRRFFAGSPEFEHAIAQIRMRDPAGAEQIERQGWVKAPPMRATA